MLCYSRNLRGFKSQNLNLLEPEQWLTFMLAGILKPMRGKRSGHKTYEISNISTIQPRLFIRYPFSGRDKRRKTWVNLKNLLNIQTDTNKDNGAS